METISNLIVCIYVLLISLVDFRFQEIDFEKKMGNLNSFRLVADLGYLVVGDQENENNQPKVKVNCELMYKSIK